MWKHFSVRHISAVMTPALCVLLAAAGQAGTLTVRTTPQDSTPVQSEEIMVIGGRRTEGVKIIAEGANYRGQTGEPDIPWQMVTVLLAPNANLDSISVHLENARYRVIAGTWQIEPTPPMGTWDSNGNPIDVWPEGKPFDDAGRDATIYSSDAFWPAEGTRLTHAGRLHQWQLAEAAVPLVRYNPVTGVLEELLSADIIVDAPRRGRGIEGPTSIERGSSNAQRGRDRVLNLAANFRNGVKEYEAAFEDILNAEDGVTYQAASADDVQIGTAGVNSKGYVIITTNAIAAGSSRLSDFVAHKQSRGWNVTVVTETQWGGGTGSTGAVNIRNWLRANYVSMDILYVLLIGNPHPDTGDVPMRWYDDGRDGGAPTDMMYSDLSTANGWDKYWEVVVGRIPYYGTMSILDNILLKTINYENSQNVLWRRNVLLPMVPLDDSTPSYQCGEQIRNALLVPKGIASTRIYDEDYGVGPDYIRSSRYPATEWCSQPYGLVVWLTHGNQTSAENVVSTSDVSGFTNAYPSATFQGSCQNAWPENSANLAFRILQNGGINTVAATRNGYYEVAQTDFTGGGSQGTLGYRYVRAIVNQRQSCGLALANAKQQDYIYPPNCSRMTTYGDPSLFLFVNPDFTPPSPNPMTWDVEPYQSGPGEITMVATAAVDPEGANVEYYFQNVFGGGKDSGWQSSRTYVDTQVTQLYNSYRVKARDTGDNLNQTAYSIEAFGIIEQYPYSGQIRTIPDRIEAEHFDGGGSGISWYDTTAGNSGGAFRTGEDVDIVSITDGLISYAIDNIENGEWLAYTVNSTAAQTETYVRIASTTSDGRILVWLDDVLMATINVPNTGSLNTWQTVSASCQPLPDRENAALKLEFVGTGFRLNWIQFGSQMPYPGLPAAIPGRLQFENYDIGGQQISYFDKTSANDFFQYRLNEPVDIMMIMDGGGSGYAPLMEATEWLEYTCDVQQGYYTMIIRSSSLYSTQQCTLSIGPNTLSSFNLPQTGGFFTFRNTAVSDIYLPGGEQVLRFSMLSSSGAVNFADFIRQYNAADITRNGQVDLKDFAVLAAQWRGTPGMLCADIAPVGGDNEIDLLDLLFLAENWLIAD